LERQGGRWILATEKGRLEAEAVILAVGAYGEALRPDWSRRFMTVQSMQIASAPLSPNLKASVLPEVSAMSDSRKLANALRLDAEGRVAISGRGPLNGRIDESVRRQLQ